MSNDANTSGVQSLVDIFMKGAPFQVAWLKIASEGPLNVYSTASKQLLAATARQLQIQADYVAKIAQCDNPADILAAQAELVQKSVGSSLESGRQIADAVSKGLPAAS